MKSVVITGSTRGLGYGMARAFLEAGDAVVVNGRSRESVDRAVVQLAAAYDAARVYGVPADMADEAQIQSLWDEARAHFGGVDIWINNAGIENRRVPLWELSAEEMRQVIAINLTGVMLACKVVICGMDAQGGGHIYNMEGMGSDGRVAPGLSVYGSTKAGLAYLSKVLATETAHMPVKISTINPGMVFTDMLMDNIPPERVENAKRIFNILADKVEDVAPWLVVQIHDNQKSGARINWLTNRKIMTRFLTAPFRKRDLFAEYQQGR